LGFSAPYSKLPSIEEEGEPEIEGDRQDKMKSMGTERLLLRPFTLEDMDGVYQEIYSDPEVLRYYSGKGVRTREETLQHVTEHLACWWDSPIFVESRNIRVNTSLVNK
jgi:RimJ/RimL family protein N-acetyltransferase